MIELSISMGITVRVLIPIRDNGVGDGNSTEEVVRDAEKAFRS